MADSRTGRGEKRSIIAAGIGAAVLVGVMASDFVIGSFWARHAMLTSLLASLLVVVITVAVVNDALERRDRRRWSLVAQSAMFALVRSARVTWTGMVELLRLSERQSISVGELERDAAIALDARAVTEAVNVLLASPERRLLLHSVVQRLSDHASDVIATWAGVMVGAGPYADVLDRHVELQGRLEWLSQVLAAEEPAPEQIRLEHRLERAGVARAYAEQFDDEWIRDMTVAITILGAQLDRDSSHLAFTLASVDWWTNRTRELISTAGG